MTTRNYSSRSQQTTLSSPLNNTATTMVVGSALILLGGTSITAGTTFTVVIDPDTALEEIVDITSVTSNTFTIVRGIDGSSAQSHSAGAVVKHMAIARDYRESNVHIEKSTGIHGISALSSVVGTTDTQTLSNKTLESPVITGTPGVDTSIIFEGTTADSNETTLTVVDPTADRTITLPDATGTVVLKDTTDTLTNKTLTSPIISGSPVITGLSSTGMVDSSAAPKGYVDSILGSATAASTSAAAAATSATNAATSASGALTSQSSATASATAAASSASAAATSATSASNSATAASNSATSAGTSATAASTSATNAAASLSSVNAAASAASASEANAATSATAADASKTAAATSASNAATSASSAASSASSAATTYDNFDDRYLGAKSAAPSVDNDGNALLVGAIYWNSTTNTMHVWSGSAWVQIANTTTYTAPTIGSTTLSSGATYTTLTNVTLAGGLAAADPVVDLGIATKQYVDAVTAAQNYHAPVKAVTSTNITTDYNNGSSGVGATLTALANGALANIDGVTLAVTDRILVKAQTTASQNGIYTVTDLGGASSKWVLTRAIDQDNSVLGEMKNGDVFFCISGTLNAGKTFVNATTPPIVIGTTPLTYSEFTTSLPVQTGQSGKYLTTDGISPSWIAIPSTAGLQDRVAMLELGIQLI